MIRLGVLMMMAIAVGAAEKPPVPNDVPFQFDPNLCPSPVMDWVIADANISLVCAVRVHNKYGLRVNLTVNFTDILVDRIDTTKDPNGGWNQSFQFAWTPPPIEEIHYLGIVATDAAGRQDRRTLLIYVVYDDAPVIFSADNMSPVSREKHALRMVEVAKKREFPMTKPVAVR